MSLPLDFLRTIQTTYLPDTCTIQRATAGTPTGDGTPATWGTLASGVACRVSPLASSASEGLGGGNMLQAVSMWTIWLPYGQDVTTKDRLVYDGRTFEIARVGARSYETVREVIAREIT